MSAELCGKRARLLGVLVLVVAGLSFGAKKRPGSRPGKTKTPSAPPVTNLYPSGTVEFPSAPPPLGVTAGTQCDTNGNIYLRIPVPYPILAQEIRNHQPVNTPLRKLSIDSQTVVTYPANSAQGYAQFSSAGFYVTPNGTVYNFGAGCSEGKDCKKPENWAWLVTEYNDDGSVDSVEKLDLPQREGVYLVPSHFAAFPDGNFLVTGETQTERGEVRPFTAVFSPGGSFLANITLPNDVKAFQPPAAKKHAGARAPRSISLPSSPKSKEAKAFTRMNRAVVEGQMVGSLNGTVYLLRAGSPERLYEIGSGGKVIHARIIKTPKPGLVPLNVSLNGQGQLLIFYMLPSAKQYWALALIDPQTGKIITTYRIPRKAGFPACMTNQGVVLSVRESKSDHLEVAEYTPE